MSIFYQDEQPLQENEDQLEHKHIPISRITISPTEFNNSEYQLENNLIKYMQRTGNNFLPVIVAKNKEKPDHYEVVSNSHILNAASKANLDYVWCLVVNSLIKQQIEIESQSNIKVYLNSATEEEIIEALEFIKKHQKTKQGSSLSQIKSDVAAKAIIAKRDLGELNNLDFLKQSNCQIKEKRLEAIKDYFLFESL